MLRLATQPLLVRSVRFSSGIGGGSGKGGGTAGAIRDAGGVFGEMEAAREEEYFRKKRVEQLAKLKVELKKAEAEKNVDAAEQLKKSIAEFHNEESRLSKDHQYEMVALSSKDRLYCRLLFAVFLWAFIYTFFNVKLVPFLFVS